MSGQKHKEEKTDCQNAAALVPNGKLSTNSAFRRSQTDSHAFQHNANLFQKYVSFLETASIDWEDSEKSKIIKVMKQRFEKADPSYLSSEDFELLILSTTENIKKDVKYSFVYIKALAEELKSYKLRTCERTEVEVSVQHEEPAGSPNPKKQIPSLCTITEPCSSVSSARLSPEVVCVDGEDEVPTLVIAKHSQSESKKLLLHDCSEEMKTDIPHCNDVLMCAKDEQRSSTSENVQHTTVSNEVQNQIIEETPEISSVSEEKKKHIQKLEKLMEKIDRKIKKLQEKELTFEDMDEESVYTLEDRLKRKFVKVWEEWCRQVGRSSKALYQTQKRFHYKGSRYISINNAVEKFMNKKKVFPDFCDILDVVATENVSSNICLTEIQCHNIARDIFTDVGKILKERRYRDYFDLYGCYLTDGVSLADDPADHDEKLRLELDHNRKECEMKLDKLLESYVQMQEEKCSQQDDVSTSEEEDNDEELCPQVDGKIASCSSGGMSSDEFLPDSLKMTEGSLGVISQSTSTEASLEKSFSTPDEKTKPLSSVACTSSRHIAKNSSNLDEVSTFQSVKHANNVPKVTVEFKNTIQEKSGLNSVDSKKCTSSVCEVSLPTSSKNYISKGSNNLRTNNKIKTNSLACGKGLELSYVSSGNYVSNLPPQNDCKTVDGVTQVHDLNKSIVDPEKTSSFVTAHENSDLSVINSSQRIKTENTSINFGKQMSGNTASGPPKEAEEIWIVSSSDSDASNEPTTDVKSKFIPKSDSKSIPHQSSNSNKRSALKGTKRISTVPVQRQNCIPDKKLCLSSVSKS